MPDHAAPTMVLLAGPNGAGKTTLYQTRVAPILNAPFVNADLIQRDELQDDRLEAAYRAARIADERRRRHLEDRTSFATGTVFSHPSKLEVIEEARQRGFRILLLHVGVDDPALSVARVAERVMEGGHDVPEDKIRTRYERGEPLIRQAALRSDLAHVYDNSALNEPPRRMLTFMKGRLRFVASRLPAWVLRIYADDLTR